MAILRHLWGHYSIIKYETENGLKIRGMWKLYAYCHGNKPSFECLW